MTTTAPHLTPDQLDAFGEELDAIRAEVVADLGERDLTYIRRVIRLQRALEATGRGTLLFSLLPPAWVAGATALSLSKIIDNMEIGHNVMHGQYDFTGDPALDSHDFEWDTTCPSTQWRHSHNYLHHTHTNILGKDKDVGYGILRMTDEQTWHPTSLGNPVYAALLALMFEWGVALHDVDITAIAAGDGLPPEALAKLREVGAKAARQLLKDYVLFPILSGPSAVTTLTANLTANVVRNLWTFTIIFCGHFPDGTVVFDPEDTVDESRGHWYYRQLLGSANITGSSAFHLMTGNLSHQIEHHLYPDLPAHRYPEIAPKVREVCERYGLPYNTGGLTAQFGSVVRKIVRLALPSSPAVASPTGPDTDTDTVTRTTRAAA